MPFTFKVETPIRIYQDTLSGEGKDPHIALKPLNKIITMQIPSLLIYISTYLTISILLINGYLCDFFSFAYSLFIARTHPIFESNGYARLLRGFGDFYIRRMFTPNQDCFSRTVFSIPGSTFFLKPKGETKLKECINMGSYNYLGFANKESPALPAVQSAVADFSATICAQRTALSSSVNEELETKIADVTRKEAAALFSMGFGCNSTFLPFLLRNGDLVLSDEKNHSSIVTGCFAAMATVRAFSHNDPIVLERMVREAIVAGQPRTHRPWRRIFILIEGLYSMEGYYPKLKEIVAIKKKYRCYLFVDEAHSFGGVGPNGRGVCDQLGVDPDDVDILMGTFTKSYGAFGGFIASKKELISDLKIRCGGYSLAAPLNPVVCTQILEAMKHMEGEGKWRLERLHSNSALLSKGLKARGFNVLGGKNSPVIVVVIGSPSTMCAISRLCLRLGVAIVVASFPATKLTDSRVRFCVSAEHTEEHIERVVNVFASICKILHCK